MTPPKRPTPKPNRDAERKLAIEKAIKDIKKLNKADAASMVSEKIKQAKALKVAKSPKLQKIAKAPKKTDIRIPEWAQDKPKAKPKKKPVEIKTLEETYVMTMAELRKAFIGKDGKVDFKKPEFEKKIGLKDLYGSKFPLLLIGSKKTREIHYAERREKGNYYYVGTNKKVLIYNGDAVKSPDNPKMLAKWKKYAEVERKDNNRALAKLRLRRKKNFEDRLQKRGGEGAKLAYRMRNNPQIKKAIRDMVTGAKGGLKLQTSPRAVNFWKLVHERLAKHGSPHYNEAYARKFSDAEAVKAERLAGLYPGEYFPPEEVNRSKTNMQPETKKETRIARADTRRKGLDH